MPCAVRSASPWRRVSEGIDSRDRLHPWREGVDRINRAAGKKQQRVQHTEDRARQQRIAHSGHDEKHHADQRQRCRQHQHQQPHEPHEIERIGNAGDHGARGHHHDARQHRFGHAREVEAKDQLELGDGGPVHGFKALILKNTDLGAISFDLFFLFTFAAVAMGIATPLSRRTL
ncbi:MAG TPA: hypothetical protein VK477_09740 [Acidobacteriota bacterium]|nr:hypothetical protein [Acidobacteriota bacterium]